MLAGCASTPKKAEFDPNDYFVQIRDGLEFKTNPVETFQFFESLKNTKGRSARDPDQFTNVLGENLSTAVLFMDSATTDKISVQVNSSREGFVKAMNARIGQGASIILTQDVRGVTDEGEFIRVRLLAPYILDGYVLVKKNPIEGRTPAEQMFVEYYQTGQPPRKLSISALLTLLKKQ